MKSSIRIFKNGSIRATGDAAKALFKVLAAAVPETPSPVIPGGWQKLERGEIRRAGDRFWAPKPGHWIDTNGVGKPVRNLIYIRKTP